MYVIVGFFPENSRIEFQAIGRAGRQGNPGKAKIIISKDEEFIYYNYYFIEQKKNVEKDEIKALYSFRKDNIKDISLTRIKFCRKERTYYYNLKKYFLLKGFIMSLLNNNFFKFYYEYIAKNIGIDITFEYYKNFVLINFDNIWSEFYSDFIKERRNVKLIFEDNKDNFVDFFTKFEKDWPECLREIYEHKDENTIKADIMTIAIQNLKDIIVKKKENSKDIIYDYNLFKSILLKLEFQDIIK